MVGIFVGHFFCQMNKGYLTAAYTHPVYLEQAVTLVLSFRLKGDETPFSLVTDEKLYTLLLEKGYEKWFDKVIVLGSEKLYQFIGKLHSALQSPYDDTTYFDSDCLLVKQPQTINSELGTKNFCVTGDSRTSGRYAGFDLKPWLAHNHIDYISIFNAGVFRFDASPIFIGAGSLSMTGRTIVEQALGIMQQAEKYKLPKADGGLNEQVALGIAMAQNGLQPLQTDVDIHYSFYNANSQLSLDLFAGQCRFQKEGIWREPLILHYTPLFQAGYYYSQSRKILMREVNKLRQHFGLPPTEFFKPSLRDKLALLRRGRFPFDNR